MRIASTSAPEIGAVAMAGPVDGVDLPKKMDFLAPAQRYVCSLQRLFEFLNLNRNQVLAASVQHRHPTACHPFSGVALFPNDGRGAVCRRMEH